MTFSISRSHFKRKKHLLKVKCNLSIRLNCIKWYDIIRLLLRAQSKLFVYTHIIIQLFNNNNFTILNMQNNHDKNELNCGIFCKIKNVYLLSYV